MEIIFNNVNVPDGMTHAQLDAWLRARVPDLQGWSHRDADHQLAISFGTTYETTIINKIVAVETQFGVELGTITMFNQELSREDVFSV